MACKTCDHTMQRVNDGTPFVYWCPRCGTLKTEAGHPEFEEPKIVKRAYDYMIVGGRPERLALQDCLQKHPQPAQGEGE